MIISRSNLVFFFPYYALHKELLIIYLQMCQLYSNSRLPVANGLVEAEGIRRSNTVDYSTPKKLEKRQHKRDTGLNESKVGCFKLMATRSHFRKRLLSWLVKKLHQEYIFSFLTCRKSLGRVFWACVWKSYDEICPLGSESDWLEG